MTVHKTSLPQKEPLVTVVIPFKNEAPTLPLTLDSLLIQETDFPFEVIFADGCSSDNSVEVILKHPLCQKATVSVLPLPQENHGMTVARNAAARVAKGKYIIFMQADVRIKDKQALAKVVRALEAPGVVGTAFIERFADEVFDHYDFWGQVFQARYLGHQNDYTYDTKFNGVRREVFEKIGGFDEKRFALGGEDMDYYVRLKAEGEIKGTDVMVEHLHGYGKKFSPVGMLKKYCRNSEVTGITVQTYWANRHLAPWYYQFLGLRLVISAVAILSLVPVKPIFPWGLLLVFIMGVVWNKEAFLHIRNWRLIWVPFYSMAAIYCFTFFFLRGMVLRKSTFQFDNTMR